MMGLFLKINYKIVDGKCAAWDLWVQKFWKCIVTEYWQFYIPFVWWQITRPGEISLCLFILF